MRHCTWWGKTEEKDNFEVENRYEFKYVVLFGYFVLSLIAMAAELISTHDKLSLSFLLRIKMYESYEKQSASQYVIG